jgi:hypothetical protein
MFGLAGWQLLSTVRATGVHMNHAAQEGVQDLLYTRWHRPVARICYCVIG